MDAMESPTPQPEPPVSAKPTRRRPLFPGWPTRGLVALSAIGIMWLRMAGGDLEQAMVNVLTFLLAFVALLTLFLWFVFRSGYSARLRWRTAGIFAALAIAAISVVRVDHISGNLIPSFRLCWQPHADELLDKPVGAAGAVDLATTTVHDFPQFLGPERKASVSGITLGRDWAAQPPQELWRIPIGAAWSGFAAVNGFAVTMEQRGDEELVTCYEIATGKPRWSHAVTARYGTISGGIGPRATPTIHGGKVYALGATGVLRCLEGATGREIWHADIVAESGQDAEQNSPAERDPEADQRGIAWGRSGSPLIVDDLVVVPLGGPEKGPWKTLAAYRAATGELVWAKGQHQASYSSPCLATLAGVRQILIVNQDSVSSHLPETGEQLWEYAWAGKSNRDANVAQPAVLPNDTVLLSKGYNIGGRLVRVARSAGGTWKVEQIWSNRRVLKTKFTSVFVRGDFVYGLSDGVLECVKWSSGESQWRAGEYGPGQVLGVEDLLLVQAEGGDVVLVEASPERHRELGVLHALSGKTWNTLCLYDHRLLVRNAEEAACYELP